MLHLRSAVSHYVVYLLFPLTLLFKPRSSFPVSRSAAPCSLASHPALSCFPSSCAAASCPAICCHAGNMPEGGAWDPDPCPFWHPPPTPMGRPAHERTEGDADGSADSLVDAAMGWALGDVTGVTLGGDGSLWTLHRWASGGGIA